jgi:hypothetical protein
MMQRFKIICALALGLALPAMCLAKDVYAAGWPTVELPPAASTFAVGDQLVSNGMPMRVQGFIAKDMSLHQVVNWFRRSMGQPLVENKLADKLILGRAQGGYYLTIQIEPISRGKSIGVKGLAAVTDVAAFHASKTSYIATVQRWRDRLPAGTQEISRISSQDGNKAAMHVVMRNGHSEAVNRHALIELLQQDGLVMEREVAVATSNTSNLLLQISNGKTLYFKGVGKEAIATIVRTEPGKTHVVLNTIHITEPHKK